MARSVVSLAVLCGACSAGPRAEDGALLPKPDVYGVLFSTPRPTLAEALARARLMVRTADSMTQAAKAENWLWWTFASAGQQRFAAALSTELKSAEESITRLETHFAAGRVRNPQQVAAAIAMMASAATWLEKQVIELRRYVDEVWPDYEQLADRARRFGETVAPLEKSDLGRVLRMPHWQRFRWLRVRKWLADYPSPPPELHFCYWQLVDNEFWSHHAELEPLSADWNRLASALGLPGSLRSVESFQRLVDEVRLTPRR